MSKDWSVQNPSVLALQQLIIYAQVMQKILTEINFIIQKVLATSKPAQSGNQSFELNFFTMWFDSKKKTYKNETDTSDL